jgi:hypothetical protein
MAGSTSGQTLAASDEAQMRRMPATPITVGLTMSALYLRLRRLLPLVIMHWSMDLFGALFTLAW